MTDKCLSCCATCIRRQRVPLHISEATSRTATESSNAKLQDFLEAGTIAASLQQYSPFLQCTHSHTEDGWHDLQRLVLEPESKTGNEQVDLGLLVAQNLLRLTWRRESRSSDMFIVRIYLAPWDPPEVHAYDIPPETLKSLRALISLDSRNVVTWNGVSSPKTSDPAFAATSTAPVSLHIVHVMKGTNLFCSSG